MRFKRQKAAAREEKVALSFLERAENCSVPPTLKGSSFQARDITEDGRHAIHSFLDALYLLPARADLARVDSSQHVHQWPLLLFG
jgi:hypothetical protein